jgi:hypothetical protein
LDVCRLPAFGSLDDVELDGLSFLKALEATRNDRRVVSEYVLAILTADEAKTLSIVEPLHCSLFHILSFVRQIAVENKSETELFVQRQQFCFGVEIIASRLLADTDSPSPIAWAIPQRSLADYLGHSCSNYLAHCRS